MDSLAVWDVDDPAWWHRHQAKSDWARAQGIPVDYTYRLEFYLVDAPFARVFAYHLNGDGKKHWTHGHDPQTCGPDHDCGACKEPPYDMPLSALPPRELCGQP